MKELIKGLGFGLACTLGSIAGFIVLFAVVGVMIAIGSKSLEWGINLFN